MTTSVNSTPVPAVASGPIRRSAEDYRSLSDEEVKAELRRLKNSSRSDDELRRRIGEELGCPYGAAVTSCSHGSSIMFMVMIHGPRGNTLT